MTYDPTSPQQSHVELGVGFWEFARYFVGVPLVFAGVMGVLFYFRVRRHWPATEQDE